MSAKILVVEDEPIIALDIQQQLIQLGYTVVAIADCTELAIAAAVRWHPNLALMDIHLQGGQNGIETAAILREQYDIPIIFLTAYADTETIQQVKKAQPYGYIVKPFETHDLSTTIEIALHKHQIEKGNQDALAKEKEFNQLKSDFIQLVSHEFRNPLGAISLALDLLERQREPLTPAKMQVYLQRARVSVDRMVHLLEEVLIVGQADAGKLNYSPAPMPVEAFCRQLVAELQLANMGTQHTLRFTSFTPTDHTDRPLYNLDETLLRHILTNLLANAIKYSPDGGSISFHLTTAAESVTFQIHDCGIGIPLSDLDQLFKRFHRASNVKMIPGTGLGLAIVKQCLDAHGGTITVESTLDVGTTFTVNLPLR